MSNRKQYFVTLGEELRHSKIEAIKSYRRIFREGLYEAKCAVDAMLPNGKSMLLTKEQVADLTLEGFKVFKNTTRTVSVFIPDDGQKINAIKKLRGCTGWGLKETKEIMDEMWNYNRPVDIGNVNEYVVVKLRNSGFAVTGWIDSHFDSDLFEI